MKLYLVFKEEGTDGVDTSSIQIFKEKRDAIVYSKAIETLRDLNKLDYHTVHILLKEVI